MDRIEDKFKYQNIRFTIHQARVAQLSEKLVPKFSEMVSAEGQQEEWRNSLVKK